MHLRVNESSFNFLAMIILLIIIMIMIITNHFFVRFVISVDLRFSVQSNSPANFSDTIII